MEHIYYHIAGFTEKKIKEETKWQRRKDIEGHYCKVCGNIIANERFSGKGHSNHICKKRSKLPLEERNERAAELCNQCICTIGGK